MALFKKNQRAFLPATNDEVDILAVVPLADGVWAEQFYEIVRVGENPDIAAFTIQENALAAID